MSEDYKIVSGQIIGNEPGQFQYGERYVKCRICNCIRPTSRLVLVTQAIDGEESKQFPACDVVKEGKNCLELL